MRWASGLGKKREVLSRPATTHLLQLSRTDPVSISLCLSHKGDSHPLALRVFCFILFSNYTQKKAFTP